MSTVAAAIRIELPGLFGPDGRYYEFTRPLELLVEQDADGNWHHNIPEFNLWVVEPDREESRAAIEEFFAAVYEDFALANDAELAPKARELKQRLLAAVKSVR